MEIVLKKKAKKKQIGTKNQNIFFSFFNAIKNKKNPINERKVE